MTTSNQAAAVLESNQREPLLKKGDLLNERWEVLEHIATGGKGEVYRAHQVRLEREVAVKVISPEMLETLEGDQEEIEAEIERFKREVLAMARLRHPNVLQVYDFERAEISRTDGSHSIDYIVMEYIPGPNLATTIPDQGLAQEPETLTQWIRAYFLPVLEGVAFMHAQGIIHRDLKPANVVLDGDSPKIADFGLVGGGQWQPVTRSHHVIGTLAYMAPEQYMDLADTDYRADVYSLGKMLYNAVVGELGKETMKPLQSASLPKPDTPFLKALDSVIQEATAQEKEQRIQSVEELKSRLQAIVKTPSEGAATQRRTIWAVAGLAVLLAGALAWGLWFHFSMPAPVPEPVASTPLAQQDVKSATPSEIIKAKDGASLRLIPVGAIELAGKNVQVPNFYLAETRVTNHQFVEFLNAMASKLNVEQGVVKLDGQPWVHLDEVKKGIEPIAFSNGRFRITDPKYASHPVLLVSGYGANAYAQHLGLRLPTRAELRRAAQASSTQGQQVRQTPAAGGMGSMHSQMNGGSERSPNEGFWPVSHWPQNSLGIQGLGASLGEWTSSPGPNGKLAIFSPVGDESSGSQQAKEPWRSFSWIGFRTARSLK